RGPARRPAPPARRELPGRQGARHAELVRVRTHQAPADDPATRHRGVNAERELGIVNAVAEALNSSPDVRQALERTLSLVADMLGLRTGWVWLLDQDTNRFYDAAERELPPYLQERVRMAGRRRCWCIDDFRYGELTPTNIDVIECSRLQPAFRSKSSALAAGLRYHASIPLYFQDKPLGIMNVTGPEWRKLTAEELRLLSTIAYQVGIAIERARLASRRPRHWPAWRARSPRTRAFPFTCRRQTSAHSRCVWNPSCFGSPRRR